MPPRPGMTTEVDARRVSVTGERPDDVFLVIRDETDTSTRIVELAIGDAITIGRDPGCNVVVDSARISREHARIERRTDALVVVDLGSRNGTWVAGVQVAGERAVGPGEVVLLGPLAVTVASSRAAPAASPRGRDLDGVPGVIAADPAMMQVFAIVKRLAALTTTVLITGETGVGKEVVAEQLHRWSPRASKPFVSLNCAALPEALAEAELFGFERGAFTGADRRKIGFFEAANEGTLLLDEAGDLSPALQAKLLRVLETRRLQRLGSTQEVAIDVRLLAATCRDLKAAVANGTFRQDLFFRLSAFQLEIPPLRERPTEIALLADLFAKELAARANEPAKPFSPDALRALLAHPWPGNARELRNAVEHAQVLADGPRIERAHLPPAMAGIADAPGAAPKANIGDQIADVERQAITDALAACGGNRTHAAERLGISRRALIYKIAKHGLR